MGKKFQRARVAPKDKTDHRGSVVITVTLRGTSPSGSRVHHTTGNLVRSITVKNAKVSEVAAAIDKALF